MTVEQALQKASKTQPADYELQGALDMGEFWAFYFAPKVEDDDEIYGLGYTTVNKDTGVLGTFQPYQDFKLFEKAKPIQIPI